MYKRQDGVLIRRDSTLSWPDFSIFPLFRKGPLEKPFILARMRLVRTSRDSTRPWPLRSSVRKAIFFLMASLGVRICTFSPVSYTHLDVYKRQANGLIHIGMSSLIIFCSANCWRVIIQQFSYSKNHAIFPGVILSFSVRFFV